MSHRSPGEGTVSRRGDGRWEARLQVDGARRVAYAKCEREARRKLDDLKAQVATKGSLPNPGRATVADLFSEWLRVCESSLKVTTLSHYRETYDTNIAAALGKVPLSRLRPERIQRLYAALQARSPSVADRVHRLLHRAFRIAVLWRWLPENPADRVVRPKYRAAPKEVWSAGELRAYLEGSRDHWLWPLWATAIASGARIGELLATRWQDLDLAAGTIAISKTMARVGGEYLALPCKTAAAERRLALPPQAVAALKRQKAQQAEWRLKCGTAWQNSDYVFTSLAGGPLHRSTPLHALKRECKRLGLPVLAMHTLRHQHASALLAEGVPLPVVSKRLGHAHVGVTARIYSHSLGDQDAAAAQAIARAMNY